MQNGNFLAQAYTILAGLNVIIQSMGSMELLSQEIQHLGAAHVPRQVSVGMFEVIHYNKIKAARLSLKTYR